MVEQPGQPTSIECSDQRGHACVGDLVFPEPELLEDLEVAIDSLRENLHVFAKKRGTMVGNITVFDNGNNYAGYVTSDAFGYYSVSLAPGSYYGLLSPPVPDFKLSPKSSDPNGSDYDPSTMKSDTVLLASGETGMGSFDAGFYEPATVTSRVWEDTDGDGVANFNVSVASGVSGEYLLLFGSRGTVSARGTVARGTGRSADASGRRPQTQPMVGPLMIRCARSCSLRSASFALWHRLGGLPPALGF